MKVSSRRSRAKIVVVRIGLLLSLPRPSVTFSKRCRRWSASGWAGWGPETMRKDAALSIALRLYPKWWRDRYLDEAQVVTNDLVATGRSRWRIATNLAFGAMRARLSAAGMPLE